MDHKKVINILINNSNTYTKIENILSLLNKKQQVQFALHCATDLDKYYDITKYKDVYNSRQKCLELLGSWLIDETSVTTKQLQDAANAAYAAYAAAYAADAAANAAVYAAYAATNAANAAYATNAAVYAVYATYAADAAANAAADAAANAADFDKVKEDKLSEYLQYLLELIGFNNELIKMVI
jgi:hypothetical protein